MFLCIDFIYDLTTLFKNSDSFELVHKITIEKFSGNNFVD